jgi:hypothetical protein
VPPAAQPQKVTSTCGYSLVLDPNSKRTEQVPEFARSVTGAEGARTVATTGLQLRQRDRAAQGIPGEAVYVPSPAAHRPAREWQLRELVARLPERQRKMAVGVFEGVTWAQSCGTLGA